MDTFHVVVRDEKRRVDHYMTANAVTHDEACTIKSKMIPDSRRRKWCRTMIVPALFNESPHELTW